MPTLASRLPLTVALLISSGVATGAPADQVSPPELTRFLSKDETILAYESADLNGDGRQDLVFIVEPKAKRDEDLEEDAGLRTLKIAVRSGDGSLKLLKQSLKAVYCRRCGGVFGDPFEGLDASKNTFSINHYGGSSWRWANSFTFAYSKRDSSWQLVRADEASFHTSDPEKQKRRSYRPPRDFGKIDIADFDPEKFKAVGPK